MVALNQISAISGIVLKTMIYFVSVTLIGVAQAYWFRALGDETADEHGYTAFNPMLHSDLIGFLALLLLGVGWGSSVPFDPSAFYGRFRTVKLVMAFLGATVVTLFLALVAMLLFVIITPSSLTLFGISLQGSGCAVLEPTSFSLVLGSFLIGFVLFNIWLSVLYLVTNAVRFIVLLGFERGYDYIQYVSAITFFAPLILLLLFGRMLDIIFVKIVFSVAIAFAHLLGVC